jgi:hypothetical protein
MHVPSCRCGSPRSGGDHTGRLDAVDAHVAAVEAALRAPGDGLAQTGEGVLVVRGGALAVLLVVAGVVKHRQDQVFALGHVVAAGPAGPDRLRAAAEVAGQLERVARRSHRRIG